MVQRPEPKSRVANDLASWKRIEDKLIERYGKKIQYDRDFLKAKRDIYRHISNKYKGSRRKLNLYEKAELKVLRGQQRNMMRQLYPNPFVRLTRNVMIFSGNLAMLPVRAVVSALKPFFTVSNRSNVSNKARVSPPPLQQQSQKESQHPPLRTVPLQQKTQRQTKAITRKMPVKPKAQIPSRQAKGVRL